MQIEFLDKFSKDLDKIRDKNVRNKIKKLIEEIESAPSFSEIRNVKKLSGFKNAYK